MSTDVEYIRLLDRAHRNTIIKCEGRVWKQYFAGVGWKQTGILLDYFCDESDTYDMYEEISEEKARRLVEQQGGKLED